MVEIVADSTIAKIGPCNNNPLYSIYGTVWWENLANQNV